jgi:ethanolamine permease
MERGELRRTLGPVMLWGLGVGYVISGEYFGWNLGLPVGGTWGMLAATAAVTVMYAAFVVSYAELACAIPRADGAFAYALRAFGPFGGALAGFFQLIEFVFAPPAIALAIGAYLNVYVRGVDPVPLALAAYVLLTALNVWGVRQAAAFELAVTIVAVVELLVFIAVVATAFRWENVIRDPLPNGWSGAFAALPFAIWFYLAIEGVANAAEEARNPQRDVAIGFGSAMATLVVLALGVFFTAVGAAGWEAIVYPSPGAEPSDRPLPLAMAHAVSVESPLYAMLVGVGLFGLVASFHGILLAAGRATLALGRASYLPRWLGAVHPRTGTPAAALVANMVAGALAVVSGQTASIITLSVFGALGLYGVSMLALFTLRRREPHLPRPFRAPGYPLVPAVALLFSAICIAAVTVAYPSTALVFLALLAGGLIAFRYRARG